MAAAQFKSLSEFFNKIAAAWFTAGIISPFFIKPSNITEFSLFAVIALGMSIFSLSLSIYLVKGARI